jgi:hypothetical protein
LRKPALPESHTSCPDGVPFSSPWIAVSQTPTAWILVKSYVNVSYVSLLTKVLLMKTTMHIKFSKDRWC